jgi:hypothetical protein
MEFMFIYVRMPQWNTHGPPQRRRRVLRRHSFKYPKDKVLSLTDVYGHTLINAQVRVCCLSLRHLPTDPRFWRTTLLRTVSRYAHTDHAPLHGVPHAGTNLLDHRSGLSQRRLHFSCCDGRRCTW